MVSDTRDSSPLPQLTDDTNIEATSERYEDWARSIDDSLTNALSYMEACVIRVPPAFDMYDYDTRGDFSSDIESYIDDAERVLYNLEDNTRHARWALDILRDMLESE